MEAASWKPVVFQWKVCLLKVVSISPLKPLNFHSLQTRASFCKHNVNYTPCSMLLTNIVVTINTTCFNIDPQPMELTL
jgi:hypothetical protein